MKYNWAIIGHEKQLSLIERDILTGNLAHSYLLAGSNSIGKYTVAKKMASILLCENNFCHQCNTCKQIENSSHIDVFEMKGKGESIKIDDVRALIEKVSMTTQSKYKIFLIQSLERMTVEASNSFLKVLEEPPPDTLFIMTTNNLNSLLPTVLSRLRLIKFFNVSTSYLENKLIELYPDLDKKTVKDVSLFSLGKTGKAIHLAENPQSLAECFEVYRKIQNLLSQKNYPDMFSYVEEIVEDQTKLSNFFDILTHVLRSKILSGDENHEKQINSLLKIEEAGILLKKNVNNRLVLENLMISL